MQTQIIQEFLKAKQENIDLRQDKYCTFLVNPIYYVLTLKEV